VSVRCTPSCDVQPVDRGRWSGEESDG
jgi:hypothetical protein